VLMLGAHCTRVLEIRGELHGRSRTAVVVVHEAKPLPRRGVRGRIGVRRPAVLQRGWGPTIQPRRAHGPITRVLPSPVADALAHLCRTASLLAPLVVSRHSKI
jgi:hypothetical protein